MNVTIFGLGHHGGGASAAGYFAGRGCRVTVTDLKSKSELAESIEKLKGFPNITYVLGEHRRQDIMSADLVIKNTAVDPNHRLLADASRIETDLSWFLQHTSRPLIAVSGTKGKSTVCSLLLHLLKPSLPLADAGGNMGISLFDIPAGGTDDPVILEVSSWQLRDLRMLSRPLKAHLAVLTSLFPDHLNTYDDIASYTADKAYLFEHAGPAAVVPRSALDIPEIRSAVSRIQHVCCIGDHPACRSISSRQGIWHIRDPRGGTGIDFPAPKLPPSVYEQTALTAVMAAHLLGISPGDASNLLPSFSGLPHRMQYVADIHGIPCYNDSAATVPESVVKAVTSFQPAPVHLIAGGTDKGLSTQLFRDIAHTLSSVHLLSGSYTRRLIAEGIPWNAFGPFDTMAEALQSAYQKATIQPGVILLSPGASSFEYFRHEFDRGDQFIREVHALARTSPGPG